MISINETIILNVTGLSEVEYGEMVMQYAEMWVNKNLNNEKKVLEAFFNSKEFWKWWKSEWENIDYDFLCITGFDRYTQIKDSFTMQLTKALYEKHHSIEELLICPDKVVYKEVRTFLKDNNWQYTPPENTIMLKRTSKRLTIKNYKK